jgi:hypothetical protein
MHTRTTPFGKVAKIASAGIFLMAVSCSRGCGHERPYTPYRMDSASSAVAQAPFGDAGLGAPQSLGGEAGSFAHVVGQRVEADGTFRLDGAAVAPPAGETIALAFSADLDGDGTRDAVAWSLGADPLAGHLLFYKGTGPGKPPAAPTELAVLAPGAVGAPGCGSDPALEQIGPHSAAVSMRANCVPPAATPLPPSRTARWVAIASPLTSPPLRLELLLRDPPAGERLGLELDASDLDSDGRDDLTARVSIEGAPPPFETGPRQSADLRWFDRPTGLSRDPEEPEASLRRAASALLARATKKSDTAIVPASVRQLTRLYAWLCSDAGSPTVNPSSGGIRCGPSRALEDAGAAEIKAELAQGDVLRAVSAFEQLGWRPATSTSKLRSDLEKALIKAAPTRVPSLTRVFRTTPDLDATGAPAWGPLTFTPSGELLVRTSGGLFIVDLQSGNEAGSPGIPTWPAAVVSPDGTIRWLGLFDPCDGTWLRARFGPSSAPAFATAPSGDPGPGMRDLPLPVTPPVPGRCAPGSGAVRLAVVPVDWGAAGLETAVAGEPVLVPSDLAQTQPLASWLQEPAHAGSPRSPDGHAMVFGTKLGALVRGPQGFQLWRPADLEGAYAYSDLRACAISNGARSIACVRDGRLVGLLAP